MADQEQPEEYQRPPSTPEQNHAIALATEVRDLSYLLQILAARAWMHGVEKGVDVVEKAARGKPQKTTVRNPYAPDFTDG